MWRNVLLVPAAMLAALLVFEVLARLAIDVPDAYPVEPGLLVLDKRGFWLPEPGYTGVMDNRVDFRDKPVKIDADGTRHVPCAAAAGDAGRRIFVIGDSQTFGFGLGDAETWPNRLQCELGPRVRVFNMGVHGVNIDQYARRVLRQVAAAARKGDVVIVGVTWNDLISPQPATSLKHARAEVMPPAGDDVLRATLQLPVKHLAPETWRYRLYRKTGLLVPVFSSWNGLAESLTHISALARFAVPRLRLLYYRLRPEDTFAGKLSPGTVERNLELLAIMADAVEKTGAVMVVYLLPNRLFFDGTYYAAYSGNGAAFPAQDYMSHLAAPFCARHGLRCRTAFEDLKTPGPDTYTHAFD